MDVAVNKEVTPPAGSAWSKQIFSHHSTARVSAALTHLSNMILWGSYRFACERCLVGHRNAACGHLDRKLIEIKSKGRPATQCEHCRERRRLNHGHSHHKCMCGGDAAKLLAAAASGTGGGCGGGALSVKRKVEGMSLQNPVKQYVFLRQRLGSHIFRLFSDI